MLQDPAARPHTPRLGRFENYGYSNPAGRRDISIGISAWKTIPLWVIAYHLTYFNAYIFRNVYLSHDNGGDPGRRDNSLEPSIFRDNYTRNICRGPTVLPDARPIVKYIVSNRGRQKIIRFTFSALGCSQCAWEDSRSELLKA